MRFNLNPAVLALASLACLVGCGHGAVGDGTGTVVVNFAFRATAPNSHNSGPASDCALMAALDGGAARAVADGQEAVFPSVAAGRHTLHLASPCTFQGPTARTWDCVVDVAAGTSPTVHVISGDIANGLSVRCP